MLTHILRAESLYICRCILIREGFPFLSLSVSLSCEDPCKPLLCPRAYWGCYGDTSYQVTQKCKKAKCKIFLYFVFLFWLLNADSFHFVRFFLPPVYLVLHKRADFLLTQSIFFCEWGNGNKKLIWALTTSKCFAVFLSLLHLMKVSTQRLLLVTARYCIFL